MGHEVLNFGMYTADDETQRTYVMNGLLAAILLNSKAVDFVITAAAPAKARCWRSTRSPACSAAM